MSKWIAARCTRDSGLVRIELDGPVEVLEGLFQDLGGLVGLHAGLGQGVVERAAGGQNIDPLQTVVDGLGEVFQAFSVSPRFLSASPRVK